MKARELIIQSDFPPAQQATVLQVLEDAWLEVKKKVGPKTAPAHERIKLASIILLLMYVIKNDPDRLKASAVRVFNGEGPPGT